MNGGPLEIPELVPVLPLPEVVLFPRAMLPLHIFEPRYRTMTADALAGRQVIAVALLKPGFEPSYYTRDAAIHDLVGVGRIVASEQLDDGNYNILLRGETRARLLEELPGRPYRFARIEPVYAPAVAEDQAASLRGQLRGTLQQSFAADTTLREHWLELFESAVDLGELADLIASGLPLVGEIRQCLLAEPDPLARSRRLLEHIETLGRVARHRHRLATGTSRLN